jgi:hypothetical protein
LVKAAGAAAMVPATRPGTFSFPFGQSLCSAVLKSVMGSSIKEAARRRLVGFAEVNC